jgi:hypothetical protein
MHKHPQGAPARTITRLHIYRALRSLTGPALAWRIAFVWRA